MAKEYSRRRCGNAASMSVEMVGAIAQIATFTVIGATAVAALVQLRHLRAANEMQAASMFIQEFEGPELRDAFSFVRTQLRHKLEDPVFRAEIRGPAQDRAKHPEVAVLNFFDLWGGHYRGGTINRTWFMRHNAGLILGFWNLLEPVVGLSLTPDGRNVYFEAFEYLAVQAQDWIAAHPGGDYPPGVRRMQIRDRWKDVDLAAEREAAP
jgi:hypothetical protein